MKPLFPSEIINSSKEFHINKHTTRSKVIYFVLLLSFVIFGLSLFLVSIDVNVQCRGIITTPSKQAEIRNAIYGRLIYLKLSENLFVNKGDTIAIIDTLDSSRSIEISKQRLELLTSESYDLERIIIKGYENTSVKGFKTLKYMQEYQRTKAELEYLMAEIENCKLDYERQHHLINNKVISQTEYEQSRYRYQNAMLKYQQHSETQLAKWQNALVVNQNQMLILQESLNNLEKEKAMCFIVSPINGYVQNLQSVNIGSTLFANQEICHISPTDSLIVEMLITPQDIGYIYLNQNIKYRVDAFNSNRWGMLTGKVFDISNDINLIEEKVIGFRVIGSLDGTNLNFDDKTVNVKKGMTLTANLILTRRTVAQLLFDDISKWLNPNIAKQ
jgi:membrane fusion protein, peptide pheromone/bacteriocin exporter